jgi:hypothetical protein
MTICTLKGPNWRSRIRARTGHFGTDPTSITNPRFETFVQAFCLKREKPIPKWHSNQVSGSLCIPVSFKSIPRVSIHHSVPRKIVFPQRRSTDNRPHWAFHSLVPYTAPLLIVIRFPFLTTSLAHHPSFQKKLHSSLSESKPTIASSGTVTIGLVYPTSTSIRIGKSVP